MSWDRQSLPDERLEELVRSILDEEIVDDVIGMAMTGWDLRDPDAALAQLVFDSADAGTVASGIRSGAATARARTFEVDGRTIDFEELDGRITGQVIPAPPAMWLETAGGVREVPVDAAGRFTVTVDSGPARLRCTTPSGMIATAWFVLGVGRDDA